ALANFSFRSLTTCSLSLLFCTRYHHLSHRPGAPARATPGARSRDFKGRTLTLPSLGRPVRFPFPFKSGPCAIVVPRPLLAQGCGSHVLRRPRCPTPAVLNQEGTGSCYRSIVRRGEIRDPRRLVKFKRAEVRPVVHRSVLCPSFLVTSGPL